VFQDPSYKRHVVFGFMYRMPEVAAALGLAQIEKIDFFTERRQHMAEKYREVVESCDMLRPQQAREGDAHAYWSYAVKLIADDVDWMDFRRRHVDGGGDGIYAAWTLCYLEDSIPDIRAYLRSLGFEHRFAAEPGLCPNAEEIQPRIMQLTTNQSDEEEMDRQTRALKDTIAHFGG
jgi:perosamine synthetase